MTVFSRTYAVAVQAHLCGGCASALQAVMGEGTMPLELWLSALALVLLFESLLPLLFPNRWLQCLKILSQAAPSQVRSIGLILLILALFCLLLVQLIA